MAHAIIIKVIFLFIECRQKIRMKCSERKVRLSWSLLCYLKDPTTIFQGPYHSRIVESRKCSMPPSKTYDPDPSYKFWGEIYNTSTNSNIFRGNLTVLREEKAIDARMKGFILEGSKWKIFIMYGNHGCKSKWIIGLSIIFRLKFDSADCGIAVGTYTFQDMNEDEMEHTFVTQQEYGRVLWRLEVVARQKTQFCWEIINETVPA